MTYDQINRLRKRLPRITYQVANKGSTEKIRTDDTPEFQTADIQKFVACYKDLSFGWNAANRLAKAEAPFPVFPEGNMRWVWLAWRMLTTKDRSYNPNYEPIREAAVIEHTHEGREAREVLQALLVSHKVSIADVAKAVGMDAQVIEAYEALFFNVVDRWEDHMMIRNHVYPHSRLEEMIDGYFEKTNLGLVLKRIGYNRGMDSVLYYAGFRSSYNQSMTNAQAVEIFQTEMTNQGTQLVRDGFLNFRKSFAPIAATRGLIQARMVGGQEMEGAGNEHGTLEDPFLMQLLEDSGNYNESLREKQREAARKADL